MSDFDLAFERAEARVGEVLRGKWRLDRVIGVGGMAAVYAATHRNGKRGALKLLHPQLSLAGEARARFLREGYVANAVDHPGAVSVLDDDTCEDGTVYLVMELLEGSTVDAIADARPDKRLELGEVAGIAEGLLDVLCAAHDKGIVHRDLKPENLFLTKSGQLRVLDFGIARLRRDSSAVTSTKTGASMGTPAFMPPEQALGDWSAVDARSDLWSVGATMFTLLTGRYVHDAENVQRMMLAAMTRSPEPVRSLRADVPDALASVVDCALQIRREDRFADAKSMLAAIRGAQAELTGGDASRAGAPMPRERASELFAAMTLPSGNEPAARHQRAARRGPGMTAAPVSSDRVQLPRNRRGGLFLLLGAGIVAVAALAVGSRFLTLQASTAADSTTTGTGAATSATQTSTASTSAPASTSVVVEVQHGASSTTEPDATEAASGTAPSVEPAAAEPPNARSFAGRPRTSAPAPKSPAPSDPSPSPAPRPTTFNGRF
ncbi:MAG: protein kinase [Polyangiaceae bacterium]|nr:protein kinase [Polyangiaceae bacterium]